MNMKKNYTLQVTLEQAAQEVAESPSKQRDSTAVCTQS